MNTTENNKLIAEFMGLNLLNSIINPLELKESQIVIGRKYIDTKEGKIFECTKTAFPLVIVQDNENGYHCANIKHCKEIYFKKELQYNSSWDWLMAVVEKIESLGVNIWIVKNKVKLTIVGELAKKLSDSLYDTEFEGYDFEHYTENNKIKAVYSACLGFIKWYNEQK